MKRIVLIAASVTILVSGCASLNGSIASSNVYDNNIDTQKMTAINNVARARGVEIHWINYPQRRQTTTDVVPALGEPTGT